MTRSVLDGVAGLGATRRTRLLKEIGSVKKLRQASLDDLKALSWLPDPVAEAVYERLHGPQLASAIMRTPGPGSGAVDDPEAE